MNTARGRSAPSASHDGADRPRAVGPGGEAEPGHTLVTDAVHEALHHTTRRDHADSADA